jgi:Tfp pilus assembly protein PilO
MKNTTAIFLLVLALGLFYTFTNPMYKSLQQIAATAEGYRSALNDIEEINESRDRLLVNYNSISRAEIERLGKVLPSNVDTVRLALDLDNIAGRYGITIQDVAIDTQSAQKASQITLPDHSLPYEKAPVSISFVSNYQNFKRFLQDLEKSLRIMDVREVGFQSTEAGLYEHTILIDTYWVK